MFQFHFHICLPVCVTTKNRFFALDLLMIVASQSNTRNFQLPNSQSIWGFEGIEQRRWVGTKLLLHQPVTIKHCSNQYYFKKKEKTTPSFKGLSHHKSISEKKQKNYCYDMSVLNDKILQQHFQRKHREEMQLTPFDPVGGTGSTLSSSSFSKGADVSKTFKQRKTCTEKNITNIWFRNDEANKTIITPLDNLALRNV